MSETARVVAKIGEDTKQHPRSTNSRLTELADKTGGEEMITAIIVGSTFVVPFAFGFGWMLFRGAFKPLLLRRELMEKLAAHFGSEEKVQDRAVILAPRLKELEQRRPEG